MNKRLPFFIFFFFFPGLTNTQFTQVSATVQDPSGIPYANATVNALTYIFAGHCKGTIN